MSESDSMRKAFFEFGLAQGKLMFRPGQGCLKHPFIDPGGPYSESLWDWDSFWSATALFAIAAEAGDEAMREQVKIHARGSLLNFFDAQGRDGSLPILMSGKDPDWFDSLDNPANNMAKPIQAQFLRLLVEHDAVADEEAVALLHAIRSACVCRTQRYLHRDSGLLVWANDVAIGTDDDPTVWGRPDFSAAHVYYNSLLAMDLEAAEALAQRFGQTELESYFHAEYGKIVAAIDAFCWDKRDGWYYSCDAQCRQNLKQHRYFPPLNTYLTPFWKVLPVRIRTFSGLLPLAAGIASETQARSVIGKLLDPDEFWTPYGIRSLSKAEDRFYAPAESRGNPSNWLGPIWIVVGYFAWRALKNYGYEAEAGQLAENTLNLLLNDYRATGMLHEYYLPETGEPVCGPGFLSWNLLAFCMRDPK